MLAAYGLAAADVVREEQEPSAAVFSLDTSKQLWGRVLELAETAKTALEKEGFATEAIVGKLQPQSQLDLSSSSYAR